MYIELAFLLHDGWFKLFSDKKFYKVILNDYKEACLIKDKITFDLYEAIGVEKCQ
ncbi:unnamed protein product [Commensalibacter communis]|nr:unnamed protein product [Commensalibacter communis]CAI3928405.1 unnamed protein product [Commensalibacter communis]